MRVNLFCLIKRCKQQFPFMFSDDNKLISKTHPISLSELGLHLCLTFSITDLTEINQNAFLLVNHQIAQLS
ncbi:Uncharacterised protein [Vibrio cholerae]|nr:Uncharacterised protein [Vibrio cholerae]